MTNKIDGLKQREANLGTGQEETVGVSSTGFHDPTGDYPKKDYFYGTSVNKAAKGERVNELFTGGGDYGVDASVPEQKPSLYPLNQVQETESGHVIEIDDTPGGERVMVKHRTGAGIEMRADGSVVISSRGRRVEVCEQDHVVIVEGEGDLVYKGNVNLSIDGDFNVDVAGNYNLTVGGSKTEQIEGEHTKSVDGNQNYTLRSNSSVKVAGTHSQTTLGDNNNIVKGKYRNLVEGNIDFNAGGNLLTTAAGEWVAAASVANITAGHVSMMGEKGTIGGSTIDFYGKSYGGAPGGATNLAAFYGTLVGVAAEALTANFSNVSALSMMSTFSTTAGSAPTGSAVPVTPVYKPMIMPFIPIPSTSACPLPLIPTAQLNSSKYGVRNVEVDPKLKDKITLSDDYDNLFTHNPNIHEIRSKLRDPANESLGSKLVSKGLLSNQYRQSIPKKIGRTASNDGTARFGSFFIGNNVNDFRSKRFKV